MLIEKSPKFIFGILAFFIYFSLMGVLIYYFNTHNAIQPKHYVKKNENRIHVSLAAPKKKISHASSKPKTPPVTQIKKKKESKVAHKLSKKPLKEKSKIEKKRKVKKVIKEKLIKKISKKPLKKKDESNSTKPSKKKKIIKKETKKTKEKKEIKKKKKIEKKKHKKIEKTSELFSKIKSKPKKRVKKEKKIHTPKVENKKRAKSSSALAMIEHATSNKQSDRGIENAYFAKVQAVLETWPAQSEYAGEKAMVRIYVKPTGAFTFKVKSKSNNVDFNLGLIDFLEQLKKLGLGSHKSGKTYEIEVEFTAKE